MPSKNYAWEFTNQRKLTKSEFINYFERKVFRTIRKYGMLPKDKKFKLKKSGDINTTVLISILEKKFIVEESTKPNCSSENLSSAAEDIFGNILKGKFTGKKPKNSKLICPLYFGFLPVNLPFNIFPGKKPKNSKLICPLYFHSDAEIKTYANLKNIKGTKVERNKKVQELFNKFRSKNPDLEINIVNALAQIQ